MYSYSIKISTFLKKKKNSRDAVEVFYHKLDLFSQNKQQVGKELKETWLIEFSKINRKQNNL